MTTDGRFLSLWMSSCITAIWWSRVSLAKFSGLCVGGNEDEEGEGEGEERRGSGRKVGEEEENCCMYTYIPVSKSA